MLALQQQRPKPSILVAQAKAAEAVHPLAQQLNARASVRRLQGQAAQLNARSVPTGSAALRQARVGEPVVQGFWPELLGVAAIGGLAAYKWWNRGAAADRKKQAPRGLGPGALKDIHGKQRAATVAALLEETEATARRSDVEVTADRKTVSGATGGDEGGYVANINPDHPISKRATELLGKDPHLRHTARLHELTHVAAWEGYAGKNRKEATPYNMVDNTSQDEFDALKQRVARLDKIRGEDPYLKLRPDKEQEFLKDRLDYMAKYPAYEFDSVLNELVYYVHLKKVPPESPFSRALVAAARTQQENRQAKGGRRK